MSARSDVFSYYPETLVIGAGITAEIPVIPGQNAITIRWAAGGSLSLVGFSNSVGCSFATANIYTLGINEVHNANMSGNVYLLASGSTVTCFVNRYKTSGT